MLFQPVFEALFKYNPPMVPYDNDMAPLYRHGMCFRASSVFVLSILF
jgi:hypothetical protein